MLGIPRGAVPDGPVHRRRSWAGKSNVVLVRKLRAPGNPEFAVGAIEESGWAFIAPHTRGLARMTPTWSARKQAQWRPSAERRAEYTAHRPRIDPGWTHRDRRGRRARHGLYHDRGAARARRSERKEAGLRRPRRPRPDTIRSGRTPYADETICLETPFDFYAVGQFYREFRQIEDEEVIACLEVRLTRTTAIETTGNGVRKH